MIDVVWEVKWYGEKCKISSELDVDDGRTYNSAAVRNL